MEVSGVEILFFLAVLAVNLFIIYVIIKAAIESATKKLNQNIAILVRLKYLELKKQGVSIDEIKQEVDIVYNQL